MTTARQVITTALTVHLNRLSPGETLDADTAATCLDALNDVVDSINGLKAMLWREVFSTGAVTGTSGTLGVTWPTLASGDKILGATVQYSAGMDFPLVPMTMERYANIPLKATASLPREYAHDGAATVYFYPAATGQTVTLRTKQVFSDFADLDTDYGLPKGFKAALAALLAHHIGPVLIGGLPASVAVSASRARRQLLSQTMRPAVIADQNASGNILSGWR